jgi:TonB-like protein
MKARFTIVLLFAALMFAGCKTTENDDLRGKLDKSGALQTTEEPKTPAGIYDKALLQKITKKWYELIGDKFKDQEGHVKVEFNLLSDGRVQDLKIPQDTDLEPFLVNACRRAILDNAPYAPFPETLRPLWKESRHIKITFQYTL